MKRVYLCKWSDERHPAHISRQALADMIRGNRKAQRGAYAHKGIDPATLADMTITRPAPHHFLITRAGGLAFHAYPIFRA